MKQLAFKCFVLATMTAAIAICPNLSAQTKPSLEKKTTTCPPLDPAKLWAKPLTEQQLKERQNAIAGVLKKADDPLDKTRAHLALANWLIAIPAASNVTACLVGMETSNDTTQISRIGKQALEHIETARQLLDETGQPNTNKNKEPTAEADHRQQLKKVTDQLEPLARLMETFAQTGDESTHRQAWSKAARSLATIRESRNKALAASARMWQAYAWEMAHRHRRALAVLPQATQTPEVDPYDFMSRLLRCRMLSDADQFAAAWALTIKIRSACPTWFAKEPADINRQRQNLVRLIQFQIGNAWLKQLRDSGDPADARQLDHMLSQLVDHLKSDEIGKQTAFILNRTIPILIETPNLKKNAAKSTSSSKTTTTPANPAAPSTAPTIKPQQRKPITQKPL